MWVGDLAPISIRAALLGRVLLSKRDYCPDETERSMQSRLLLPARDRGRVASRDAVPLLYHKYRSGRTKSYL